MAYTNQPYNYPYTFNPYQPMQTPVMQNQPVQQPVIQQQPIQQPIQPPMTQQSSGMIWVNSKQEADGWPIAPGNAVALWDSNNPIVYLRQADSTGKPSTKIYDLVERTDAPKGKEKQPDLSKYMTRDEFSSQVQEVVRDVVDEVLTERLKRPAKANKVKEED